MKLRGRPPKYKRPKTRGDCRKTDRPCIFFTCKYHFISLISKLVVKELLNTTVSAWDQFPYRSCAYTCLGDDNDQAFIDYIFRMPWTCVLDLSERGSATLEEIGDAMLITRERVRQIEARALRRVRHYTRSKILREFIDP